MKKKAAKFAASGPVMAKPRNPLELRSSLTCKGMDVSISQLLAQRGRERATWLYLSKYSSQLYAMQGITPAAVFPGRTPGPH